MPECLMENYKRQPVAFVRGEGCWLWDEAGRRYLDALAGIAVCGLGHAHPQLAQALCEQAQTLVHTSNLYRIPLQEQLAERLCALSGMAQAFFCNSGAEANEAAIKLARRYAHQRGITQPKILVTEGSFHGRTLATLSATGNARVQEGFAPLVEGFVRVPYADLAAAEQAFAQYPEIVAMLVEPITGEGGIVIPPDTYLSGLRALCDRHHALLMLDEIQTGIGRTGHWFAFQRAGIVPDVLSLAKGLGNGLPIGASLVRGPAAGLLTPGTHGTTFGGNPLVCRAALTVLEIMEQGQLCEQAAARGERLRRGLEVRLADVPGIRAIRGRGLMLGIELERPCADLVDQAREQGLLLNVTAERVVRLLPPLIITEAEVDELVARLGDVLQAFTAACKR
ncbi:acetylornithine transaminase [Thiorhodospira sibirica]|uniref:acetylornithine transaminase n=1 Tax=Thiorhodospira sibirica TaxID=154347 RepID=UPI00022C33EE|nr:acetylornithine transaminase [Thiorhodospira sibirica]